MKSLFSFLLLFIAGPFFGLKAQMHTFEPLTKEETSEFYADGLFTFDSELYLLTRHSGVFKYDGFDKFELNAKDEFFRPRLLYTIGDEAFNVGGFFLSPNTENKGHVNHKKNDTIVYSNGMNSSDLSGISFDGGKSIAIEPVGDESHLYFDNSMYIAVEKGRLFAKNIVTKEEDSLINGSYEPHTLIKKFDDKYYLLASNTLIIYDPSKKEDRVIMVEWVAGPTFTEVDLEVISPTNIIISDSRRIYRYDGTNVVILMDHVVPYLDDSYGESFSPKSVLFQKYEEDIFFCTMAAGIIRTKDFMSFDTLGLPSEYEKSKPIAYARHNGYYYGTTSPVGSYGESLILKFNEDGINARRMLDGISVSEAIRQGGGQVAPRMDLRVNHIYGIYNGELLLTMRSALASAHLIYVKLDAVTLELISARYYSLNNTPGSQLFDTNGEFFILSQSNGGLSIIGNDTINHISVSGGVNFSEYELESIFIYEDKLLLMDNENGVFASRDTIHQVRKVTDIFNSDGDRVNDEIKSIHKTSNGIYGASATALYMFSPSEMSFKEAEINSVVSVYDQHVRLVEYDGQFIAINNFYSGSEEKFYSLDNGDSWHKYPTDEYGDILSAFKSGNKYVFGSGSGTFYFEDASSVEGEETESDARFIYSVQSVEKFASENGISNYKLFSLSGGELTQKQFAKGLVLLINLADGDVYYISLDADQ